MKLIRTIILATTLAAGGCSVLDFKPLGKESLTNSEGHVIGYVERLCDCGKGEELDRVVLFTPRLDRGRVVAYEERIKGGAIFYDVSGKRIGTRYVDLRSRGSNAHNAGLTIVFVPGEPDRVAATQISHVTIEDIKQHLRIAN
jgi:hypothetical protein